jgi:hypothetical protein
MNTRVSKNSTEQTRHWTRFSIRTLLILVACISLPLGWWASSAMKQARATAAIKKLGGNVTYSFQVTSAGFRPNATPSGPSWLRTLLGRDWFDSVQGVQANEKTVNDDNIASALRNLPDTRSLQLDFTQVGDRTLQSVGKMPKLLHLSLYSTNVTDDGLPSLYGLTKLTALELRNTKVTHDGIAKLKQALPACGVRWQPE